VKDQSDKLIEVNLVACCQWCYITFMLPMVLYNMLCNLLYNC
jgi:hypothetical protein